MTPDQAKVNRFLNDQKYMTLSVTLDDDTPWAIPVIIQRHDGGVFEWDSRLDAVHSRVISQRPLVAISLFSADKGAEICICAKAEARLAEQYNEDYGRYSAVVSEAWLNDETHRKRRIVLPTSKTEQIS